MSTDTDTAPGYKRKLIEVALPLEDINRESQREGFIYRGNPSSLQKWWAQRPLAASRAVLFAQLVDDPSAHGDRFPTPEAQQAERERLFAIIRELVKWENSRNESLLASARREIWDSCNGSPPPLTDPFAGGGSIPLEAQRLGLETYASDLNPVAVLINKALIELPPKWAGRPPVHPGARSQLRWTAIEGLAEDARCYGQWIREEAERRIGHLYPKIKLDDGTRATVIAWIWARTVTCPNPACGGTMPLVRSFWLSKRKGKERYAYPVPDGNRVKFQIRGPHGRPRSGTVSRTGAECLLCGAAVPLTHIRSEGQAGRMGAQLIAIAAEGLRMRHYQSPTEEHEKAAEISRPGGLADTQLSTHPQYMGTPRYGLTHHADLFTNRQLVALSTFCDLIREAGEKALSDAIATGQDHGQANAYASTLRMYLSFVMTKLADYSCTGAVWYPQEDRPKNMFSRQAIPIVWDYPEVNVFAEIGGSWTGSLRVVCEAMLGVPAQGIPGHVEQADAAALHLANGAVIATDPPYYDNVPYADLSDFFYIWLRCALSEVFPDLMATVLTPKTTELVADQIRFGGRDAARIYFEDGFRQVFKRIRDGGQSEYPITVFYAFKQSESDDHGDSSTGWQTLLDGIVGEGWQVTSTWPMRTERSSRMRSLESNALASSIVLACRPRGENAGTTDRRGFLALMRQELPGRLRELQQGNIAPVDLAQAAIGPGMAVFSRHRHVTEPDGSAMRVRTALQLINQVLDEVLAEQEGDFDTDSRWCLKWFQQMEWDADEYGRAETLATALNTAVSGLERAGVLQARAGKVRLLRPSDLPDSYDPANDARPTMWEAVLYLSKRLEQYGPESAGQLMRELQAVMDLNSVRELAYLLYSICERKQRQDSALIFNNLVTSWPDIADAARNAPTAAAYQAAMDFTEE